MVRGEIDDFCEEYVVGRRFWPHRKLAVGADSVRERSANEPSAMRSFGDGVASYGIESKLMCNRFRPRRIIEGWCLKSLRPSA